jgi:hypothetical protein
VNYFTFGVSRIFHFFSPRVLKNTEKHASTAFRYRACPYGKGAFFEWYLPKRALRQGDVGFSE